MKDSIQNLGPGQGGTEISVSTKLKKDHIILGREGVKEIMDFFYFLEHFFLQPLHSYAQIVCLFTHLPRQSFYITNSATNTLMMKNVNKLLC